MPAAIDVSVKASSIVDQKTIQAIFLADEPELPHRSWRELIDLSNHARFLPTFLPHPPLIAQKYQAVNYQSGEIKH